MFGRVRVMKGRWGEGGEEGGEGGGKEGKKEGGKKGGREGGRKGGRKLLSKRLGFTICKMGIRSPTSALL